MERQLWQCWLVWPEDQDSEVCVLIKKEHITVIATGIMSGHMMDEEAWIQESGNFPTWHLIHY